MVQRAFPVFNIEHFKYLEETKDFYVNDFLTHLKEHHFINTPHKHDFYLVILFTKGSGSHEIDFLNYPIKPGSVFLMTPGQIHTWKLSEDINGYVFFHSKEFYDLNFNTRKVSDFPFYFSMHNSPLITLKNKEISKVETVFKEILEEYKGKAALKFQKLCALTDLLYIDLSRLYLPHKKIENQNKTYLSKLRKLEELIDLNYVTIKYPKDYAALMHMSEKHLNRICKSCLNKTTGDLISDRILLEAKRILVRYEYQVSRVAEDLGYMDTSYFVRFFKKRTGSTPLEFAKKYK